MADLPLDVLAVYAAFVIWVALWLRDIKRQSYTPTVIFGTVFLLALNVRYLIDGAADGIAFFVSIYDVFDNLGLAATESAPALATCANNACSMWGEHYLNHSSWGVAFHDRFLNGPALRSNLLYAHLTFNSIVFVLMHIQLARPGGAADRGGWHRTLGKISFALLTLGTASAVWLAAEHGEVGPYGGDLAKYGFWSMALCVYACAIMGVVAIKKGDAQTHRVWMIRFAGSMWGSFWLFRMMLLVTGPLLREWETASILISIWFSAPLGVLIAEMFRIRWDRRAKAPAQPVTGSVAAA